MEGYFYLGRIIKPFASKGALQVSLEVDEPENYLELESVFVLMNGQLIPFFIEDIILKHNNRAVITFTDINSVEQASIVIGCQLYLPDTMLPELNENQFYYHEVKGYEVHDKNRGIIGIVNEVLEYPHQAVLSILMNNKEILIPITDEIVYRIDRKMRHLYTDAPEGLIDIYLE